MVSTSTAQLSHLPPAIWPIVAIVIIVIIVAAWKTGWLRALKRLKVGPIEAERFEASKRDQEISKPTEDRSISASHIELNIQRNRFEDEVGDIAGIIVKGKEERDSKKE